MLDNKINMLDDLKMYVHIKKFFKIGKVNRYILNLLCFKFRTI